MYQIIRLYLCSISVLLYMISNDLHNTYLYNIYILKPIMKKTRIELINILLSLKNINIQIHPKNNINSIIPYYHYFIIIVSMNIVLLK